MMLIDSTFELGIPTHIQFTLYKFDHIDSMIISRVLKDCKNYSEDKGLYTIKVDSFKRAILNSKRLSNEVREVENVGLLSRPNIKPNSIFFIWSIIERLNNLEWLSFEISYDKKFTRMVELEGRNIHSFYFSIVEGIFDLTKIFDHNKLDIINKKMIELNFLNKNYLERLSYVYLKTSELFEIFTILGIDEGTMDTNDILDQIDDKLEQDDPLLLVKTDYTPY